MFLYPPGVEPGALNPFQEFLSQELLYPLYLLVGLAWGARHWEERGA